VVGDEVELEVVEGEGERKEMGFKQSD